MTHQAGLENRRSGNATEGSNPSLSAVFCGYAAHYPSARNAPFTPRSDSSDGAQVGTLEDEDRDPFPPEQVAALTAILHEDADRCDSMLDCYFIGGDGGEIKIGFSEWPERRLKSIRGVEKRDIRVLATRKGGREREAAYHWQFRAHRTRGEWFDPHPDILAEIDRLNSPGPKRGCNLDPALSMNESDLRYAC